MPLIILVRDSQDLLGVWVLYLSHSYLKTTYLIASYLSLSYFITYTLDIPTSLSVIG